MSVNSIRLFGFFSIHSDYVDCTIRPVVGCSWQASFRKRRELVAKVKNDVTALLAEDEPLRKQREEQQEKERREREQEEKKKREEDIARMNRTE